MGFHMVADCVSLVYGQGTTMRNMPVDHVIIPKEFDRTYLDRFYALSQFGATALLIFSDSNTCDFSFMVLFAIQISTFLMTLRLKGIIDNDTWHICYSTALLMNFQVGYLVSNGNFCAFLYIMFYTYRIHGKETLIPIVSPILKNKYIAWSCILGLAMLLYPLHKTYLQ
jgi:hypothetical protein